MTRLLLFLQTNKADSRAAEGTDARILDHDCDALKEAIYFSRDKYQAERIRLYNLRKFNFPDDADAGEDASTILLAPTALGNVARTAHRYAEDTYCFDLDVLWTRLDQALRTSDPFYKTLENAKVQLDFYVACASLAWITTAAWLLLHLALLRSVVDFVIIGVVGPLVAHGAYELACRAYKVFADVMRTGVDLFRFKVLTDLHLPLPLGLEEERIAWLTLANVMGYQNLQAPDGSSASFTYKHPA
jgi:hypothetical protein